MGFPPDLFHPPKNPQILGQFLKKKKKKSNFGVFFPQRNPKFLGFLPQKSPKFWAGGVPDPSPEFLGSPPLPRPLPAPPFLGFLPPPGLFPLPAASAKTSAAAPGEGGGFWGVPRGFEGSPPHPAQFWGVPASFLGGFSPNFGVSASFLGFLFPFFWALYSHFWGIPTWGFLFWGGGFVLPGGSQGISPSPAQFGVSSLIFGGLQTQFWGNFQPHFGVFQLNFGWV